MILQTQLNIPKAQNAIDYTSKILLLGSCFAEHIGERLQYFKFQHTINPFGILFHPVAIENVVKRAVKEVFYTEEDVFYMNEKWQCFEVHSQLSNISKEDLIDHLNKNLLQLKEAIENATHIICTYGTSWGYRNIAINKIVANCHKVPQKQFAKELWTPDAINKTITGISQIIAKINPKAIYINTVSPVRHIKDGIVENSLSKAHLLSGIHQYLNAASSISNRQSPIKNLESYYFPSYEIMMDELRDYRFYAKDLIHPNEIAIEMIWDKFNATWIADATIPLQKKIDAIQKGLRHKPFHENSEAHLKFKNNLQNKIAEVQKKLSGITFKNH